MQLDETRPAKLPDPGRTADRHDDPTRPEGEWPEMDPKPSHRDAVLEQLHIERRALLRKRRTEGLHELEQAYLNDVLQDIDALELPEGRRASEELWQRIDNLASRVLSAHKK